MAKQLDNSITLEQIKEMKAAAWAAFVQQNSAPYIRFEDMVKKQEEKKEN